jgi:hypothetical protein
MTDQSLDQSFERELRELFQSGSRAAPPTTLERALVSAALVGQRHARFERLNGRAWPPRRHAASDPAVHRLVRVALAALAVLLAGVMIAVGARLADRLAPPTTPPPSQLPPSLSMTVVSAGTMELPSRDNVPVRLWPDGRLLLGHEHLFHLATGTTEELAVVFASGAAPSVFPIPDGRVVLIDDKGGDGAIAQGQHRVAVLDVASGAVTEVGRLPAYAYEERLVLRDGRIFGSGGLVVDDLGGETLDSAYVFDIETGSTTQLAPLRQPRSGHVMVELLDGRVLLFGGERPEAHLVPGPVTWVEVYDLETGVSTAIEDPEEDWGWGPMWPYAQLADGQVVLPGPAEIEEPCPFFPEPRGGIIGGGSGREIVREHTYVLDPATLTIRPGPLVRPPAYAYVPLDGQRALFSRQERAYESCDVEETVVRYPWLGIVDFGSGTILGSPNALTGEGTLDIRPEAVYSNGVLLPDGRVALIDVSSELPVPTRRIDILSIEP